jgi:membrane-bound lytic murein transglycosylase D
MATARFYFDRCIDITLDSQKSVQEKNSLWESYLDKIASLELTEYRDGNGTSGSDAFLDEVIATPLFPPTPIDIQNFQNRLQGINTAAYSIPIKTTPAVVSFFKSFQTIRHEKIQRALNRSIQYIDRFKETFRKYQLPEDLAYLPIIESGYRVNAVSRARAKGIWQFISSTARLNGLRVDWIVDERLDPFKSAEAAAKYLKYLYEEYQDWYLALACYNGGGRRIRKAMNALKTKDFFEICQSRYLRRETRNYVPAFLAALIIAKSPQESGFAYNPEEDILAATKGINVPSPASLAQIASLLGVSQEQLQQWNPELLQDFTPSDRPFYLLRVSRDSDETKLQNMERVPPQKLLTRGVHLVRRGDTLYSIARRYRISVAQLKKFNRLRSNRIHPGTQLVIPRGFR